LRLADLADLPTLSQGEITMPLIPSQQRQVDDDYLVRVVAHAGHEIRGVKYFEDTDLLMSKNLAEYYVLLGAIHYPEFGK
jgi:hypothetical protein